MGRRGDQLRDHILWAAKDVFLEMGFERASMDVVAARAETSKRSLYAHFESKEKLFLAVIELVRGLLLSRLGAPGEYAKEPAEALTMFCSRYLEILLYEASIQLCRVSTAETRRFPAGAAQHFDVVFTEVDTRLTTYLKVTFGRSARDSTAAAQRLMAQLLYPRFLRALFGLDKPIQSLDREAGVPDLDLKPIRKAVADAIEWLQARDAPTR